MKKFTNILLSISVVSTTLFTSHWAKAEDTQYVLNYSYAELKTEAGRKAVLKRIVRTARQYCPSYSQVRSLKVVQECVDGVVADLVDKVEDRSFIAFVEHNQSLLIE